MAIANQVVSLNAFMLKRCVSVALEEVQLIGIWIKNWRKVYLSTLKFNFICILNKTFTCKVIYLPISIWFTVFDLAAKYNDSSTSNWKSNSIMDWISKFKLNNIPFVKLNAVSLNGVHRTIILIVASECKNNLIK
jgi:hypothetical protein